MSKTHGRVTAQCMSGHVSMEKIGESSVLHERGIKVEFGDGDGDGCDGDGDGDGDGVGVGVGVGDGDGDVVCVFVASFVLLFGAISVKNGAHKRTTTHHRTDK